MYKSAKTVGLAWALFTAPFAIGQDVQVIELGGDTSVSSAKKSVSELSIQASGRSLAGNQNTQLYLLLQQLQDEVRSLRGQIESQSHKLSRLESEQKDRYRDLDRRMSFMTQNSANRSAKAPSVVTTMTPSSGGPATLSSQVSKKVSTSISDQQAYQAAFSLVRTRAYDKAIVSFESFVEHYPQSALLPNAHYWLGEIYLLQQKQPKARSAFLQVITKHPEHRKAPDAAYKLGKLSADMGDAASSKGYIDMVLTKYPDSSAARLAREFQRNK